jgi:hypothetical protein
MLCAAFHNLVEAMHVISIMYNLFYKIGDDDGGGGGDIVYVYFVLSMLCKCD